MMKLYDHAAGRGDNYVNSVRLMLKAVLVSPKFLFRIEQDLAPQGSGEVYRVSEVYQQCGIKCGDFRPYQGRVEPGHALVVPPRFHCPATLPGLGNHLGIAVTGWARMALATCAKLDASPLHQISSCAERGRGA